MASSTTGVVLGIDVGTSGVRALAVAAEGDTLAEAQTPLLDLRSDPLIHQQNPDDWWRAVCHTARSVVAKLMNSTAPGTILGVAFTSTSGSLVLGDGTGRPVCSAILYDDSRGASLAAELNQLLPPDAPPLNSSYSLVKAMWVCRNQPAVWERARLAFQPTDWLTGKLTGEHRFADDSNALKLGYDAQSGTWSPAVSLAAIPAAMLPQVVYSGTRVGGVCPVASAETGLPPGIPVFAGATDGMAGLIASGASEPGHANTTLGTTLVWKVLSRNRPQLAPGVYCHRFPSGLWAPGAASNSGPGSLLPDDSGRAPSELDRRAASHLPNPHLCYLLRSKGERFPFLNSQAEAFLEGSPATRQESRAGQLQCLAFVERWGYERLQQCGLAVGPKVFSTGSAAASPVLSQLRASVLHREVGRCRTPVAAFGAAILAAAQVFYGGDLEAAIKSLTHVAESYVPKSEDALQYDELYGKFRTACSRRGYQ